LTIKQHLTGTTSKPPPPINPIDPIDPVGPSDPVDPSDPSDPPGVFRRVQVVEREFTLTLSRPKVTAGQVIVEMVNMGEDPHNVYLQRIGSSDPVLWVGHEDYPQEHEYEPGTVRASTFDLAPGVYKVWCEVNGHESLGMVARLTVE
jgi:plastocyanin